MYVNILHLKINKICHCPLPSNSLNDDSLFTVSLLYVQIFQPAAITHTYIIIYFNKHVLKYLSNTLIHPFTQNKNRSYNSFLPFLQSLYPIKVIFCICMGLLPRPPADSQIRGSSKPSYKMTIIAYNLCTSACIF